MNMSLSNSNLNSDYDIREPAPGERLVKILGIISSVIFIAGAFVPYVRIKFMSNSKAVSIYDGTRFWGFVILLFGALAIFLAVVKQFSAFFGIGGVCAFFALHRALFFAKEITADSSWESRLTRDLISYSYGYYMLWIGSIAMVGVGILAFLIDLKLSKAKEEGSDLVS